jgi:uncharacterized protein
MARKTTKDSKNTTPSTRRAPEKVTAEHVIDFLRKNQNFLAENPDLVTTLAAPSRWAGDDVVDLQQIMVKRLQDELDGLRDCAQDVIETSRGNMSTQTRAHASVLALISATTMEQTLFAIGDELPVILDIDIATIGFEPAYPRQETLLSSQILSFDPGFVDETLGAGQKVALFSQINDDGALFGEGCGLVHSAALARISLGKGAPVGLLALGSRKDLFSPNQGTELFAFIADVLERRIQFFIECEDASEPPT